MKKLIVLLCVSSILIGCNSLGITEQKVVRVKQSETIVNKNSIELASYPTQLRSIVVYTDDKGKKTVCAEPFADVAASSSLQATANAMNKLSSSLNNSLESGRKNSTSYGNESTDAKVSTSGSAENALSNSSGASSNADQSIALGLNAVNQIVALEGRTQFVLLAREMLFRTCEAAANGTLPDEKSAVAIQHKEIISALVKMIDAQKAESVAKTEQAKAEQAKALVSLDKLDAAVLNPLGGGGVRTLLRSKYIESHSKCIQEAEEDEKKVEACNKSLSVQLDQLKG